MIADAASADLHGAAYGFFNLMSGIAMLIASALAGLLWGQLGDSFTFIAGASLSMVATITIGFRVSWQPNQKNNKPFQTHRA